MHSIKMATKTNDMTTNESAVNLSNFKKLSDVEHIRMKPGMYIGAMEFRPEQECELYRPEVNPDRPIHRVYDSVQSLGLNTMFKELIENSYDERARGIRRGDSMIVNRISVIVNQQTGKLAIWDNGGISVVMHPDYNEWLPQMIFGYLRSGSNFVADRGDLSGTNGLGASLVNVMSKSFKVITAKDGKQFEMTWYDGMSKHTEPKITKCKKSEHFTYVEAFLDLNMWEYVNAQPLDHIPNDTIDKWLSRSIEVAVMGCDVNNPLVVEWHNESTNENYEFKFKHFWEYKDLWEDTEEFRGDENEHYSFEIGPSRAGFFESFALVNSIRCDYGTHMDFIANVCADFIIDHIKAKYGFEPTKKEVFKHMSILSMWKIPNPEFDAQVKDRLATKTNKFGFPIMISDKLKKYLTKTTILERILTECKVKKQIEEEKQKAKEAKELNKKLEVKTKQFHVNKLVDATQKTNRYECELFIVEGDSASQGIRVNRNSLTQGFYCIRGKSIGNCYYDNPKKLIDKPEIAGLMQSLGLRFNEKADINKMRYGKISILTDADVDGYSISSLLQLFFYKFWPELFDMGVMYNVVTPIIICNNKKTGEERKFYFYKDFNEAAHIFNGNKDWEVNHKKGLASLTAAEFADIMQQPVREQITSCDNAWDAINAWLGGDSSARKTLMGFVGEDAGNADIQYDE